MRPPNVARAARNIRAEAVATRAYGTALGVPLLREGVNLDRVLCLRANGSSRSTERQIAFVADLRRPGGDRDREYAADHRDARGIGAADRHGRGFAGHQLLARRSGAVFEAMLEKAMRLCEATFGQLAIYEDGRFRTTATRGMPAAFVEFGDVTRLTTVREHSRCGCLPESASSTSPTSSPKTSTETGDPNRRGIVDLGGVRSSLMVPLLRDDTVLGFINIYRQEPRPFSGQTDRAARKLCRPGGDRDGQCAAVGRDPPTPGRIARHLRQHGRWRRDVRRRTTARRLEPEFPANSRPARRAAGGASELSPTTSASSPNAANSARATSRRNSAAASRRSTRSCASSTRGPTAVSSRCGAIRCQTAGLW